jgi:ribonuclease D
MLITKQDELDKLCAYLVNEKVIAIDTEFVRERTYYPILSLIQIATSTHIFAIDVLADLDLRSIQAILTDSNILKIFHAARQDIEILCNHFGNVPISIFDTQIAAQFVGFVDPPSYDKLVKKYCGVTISKHHQFSDWLKRPLLQSQLEYALDDVAYLIRLKELLSDEISVKQMLLWLDEENKSLENYTYKAPEAIDYLGRFLKDFKGIQNLSRVYVLLEARERQAEALNKPRNFILKDDHLIETVKREKFSESLAEKLNLTEKQFIKQAENPQLHSMIKGYILKSSKRIEVDVKMLANLKNLLAQKAQELGISASLIANRSDLVNLVNHKAHGTRVLMGWRNIAFGKDAMGLTMIR